MADLKLLITNERVVVHGQVRPVGTKMMAVTVPNGDVERVIEQLRTGFGHPAQWELLRGESTAILSFQLRSSDSSLDEAFQRIYATVDGLVQNVAVA